MLVRIRNCAQDATLVGKGRDRRIARLREENLFLYSGVSLVSITLTNLFVSYTSIPYTFISHISVCSLLKNVPIRYAEKKRLIVITSIMIIIIVTSSRSQGTVRIQERPKRSLSFEPIAFISHHRFP